MKKKVAVKLKRWEAEKLKAQSESSKERFTAEDAKNSERFGADSKAHGAKRSKSWEEGKLKAQASKRYDDGRLRIKAEAKKSVASNLQLPTAEGLLNHLNHPLKLPWKQKKNTVDKKARFHYPDDYFSQAPLGYSGRNLRNLSLCKLDSKPNRKR